MVDRRGRRLYDRWGDRPALYGAVDRLSRSLRRRAVGELDVPAGGTVVDLGCGPGGSFDLLASAVGPSGRVLGVDYSAAMVRRARRRARDRPGVGVARADAGRLPLPAESTDGAFASLALSAMPEARAVLADVRRVLAADGRLVVATATSPTPPGRGPWTGSTPGS